MSANLLVMFGNLLDTAISLTASSTASGLPITNVNNAHRTVIWRSATNGAVTIDMQLDGSFYSHIALVDHNLTSTGIIRLEGWSDGFGGALSAFDITMNAYDYASSFGSGLYGGGGYGGPTDEQFISPVLIVPIGNIQGAKYVRITLNDVARLYYQIGRIFVDNVWQPLTNMSFGWSVTPLDNTSWKKSASGQEFGNVYPSNMDIDFSLDHVDDATRDNLWFRLLQAGFHRHCILQMRPMSGQQRLYLSFYGKFVDRKMIPNRLGNSPFKIKFRESL